MKEVEQKLIYNTLREQYISLDLPTDSIDTQSEFTIHNLKDIHNQLPYKSPVYRTNFFSFVFVKEGAGQYTTDEQVFVTVPGTIYFTNPGHFKSFEWRILEEVYLITLSEAFLKENVHADIFEEFPFLLAETVAPRVLPPDQFAEFETLYQLILKEYTGNSSYKNKMIGNLFVVLLLKIKDYFWNDYNPIYEGNRSSYIVKTFKQTLEKHFRDLSKGLVDKPLRVQDYADAQNLHPNYLSNVIKTKTGKSISTWITEKTITEAKSLLQNSSVSIKEIAFLLGFSESTHFSNYFKKYTQVSPVAYRKQHTST
ncbi:AraC family transcriptional regulator [Cytophagaceae bacterium YF14B1]|uniref:AraC family transcriptional regulator n=1 Tax=Xanthocytophaga flava TaxID=3048013 RepID=A0AAE3UC04_9BACT|nr:AraC family transcriptional regulator [Xanthocytophaga flavus]MDJ1484953.1 AraC family transcriptional regulator [Xanthocytophaga flavus]